MLRHAGSRARSAVSVIDAGWYRVGIWGVGFSELLGTGILYTDTWLFTHSRTLQPHSSLLTSSTRVLVGCRVWSGTGTSGALAGRGSIARLESANVCGSSHGEEWRVRHDNLVPKFNARSHTSTPVSVKVANWPILFSLSHLQYGTLPAISPYPIPQRKVPPHSPKRRFPFLFGCLTNRFSE